MFTHHKQIAYSFLILLTWSSLIISTTTDVTSNDSEITNPIPTLNAINATSSTEYFNETSHPRYNLVGRPIDLIMCPNKGNPKIVEFNETFEIVVNAQADADEWEFSLRNDTTDIPINILTSNYLDTKWYFEVVSTLNQEGLYDLQLNCSEGDDYQTHSVKIIEERSYPFKFLHISDSHFPSYDIYNTTDINLKLIQVLKNLDVEFAIFTGDVIEGASARMFVDPVTGLSLAAEVQLKLGLWALDLLDMPVYIIAGNHDLDTSTPLPDDPPVIWREYLGSYPIMNFDYLNWSFLGYSATRTGLTTEHYNDVRAILNEKSANPNILFYHSDYKDQATNLRNSYNIEVMLYGHEHNYEEYVSKDTLYFCQDAMFNNESSVFTVLNSTAVSVKGTEYDFTPLIFYTEIPTTDPTNETTTPILLSLIPALMLFIHIVRKEKK